ncbi:hypothetical protein VTJ04DRAFT_1412 [Mycothermus thermophilus]|uniref:uncharacterized protein n=1 Tax=Humicola insolens TaxID=85995 RepID=UPI0037431E4C
MPMTSSEEEVGDAASRLPGPAIPVLNQPNGVQQANQDHSARSTSDNDDGIGYSDEEDENDDTDEDDDDPPPPPFSQHAFAPPFYGRPPTPLPPSPSLTSLLRPSRPTTPDASDDDAATGGHPGSSTPGGHHPHHHHSRDGPVPRARPKVPTYEYYGFVLYLFSSLSFLIYLLWSYLPSPFLHALGIYYYPNRWWSLAIPSFLVMLIVYIYVALAGYNLEILTLPMESVETVVDEAAKVAVVDSKGRIIREDKAVGVGAAAGLRRRNRKDSVTGGGGGGGGSGRRRRGTVTREAVQEKEEEEDGKGQETPFHRRRGVAWKEAWNEGTDAVMDVPLAGVCEVLYGEGREWDSGVDEGDVGITVVS